MKLVRPIKFKRGVNHLISFLDAYNGINPSNWTDHEEWLAEVAQIKHEGIDPKDWYKFDCIVAELEILGDAFGKANETFEMESDFYYQGLDKLLNKLKKK